MPYCSTRSAIEDIETIHHPDFTFRKRIAAHGPLLRTLKLDVALFVYFLPQIAAHGPLLRTLKRRRLANAEPDVAVLQHTVRY